MYLHPVRLTLDVFDDMAKNFPFVATCISTDTKDVPSSVWTVLSTIVTSGFSTLAAEHFLCLYLGLYATGQIPEICKMPHANKSYGKISSGNLEDSVSCEVSPFDVPKVVCYPPCCGFLMQHYFVFSCLFPFSTC